MDPFEVRMHFIELLRRLNASQQSIQKVVSYAIKHFPPCGEDIWDCIVEETQKGTINSRINILYFIDSLCETCLLVKSRSTSERSKAANANGLYVSFVSRDLSKIIEFIVPEGRQGLPNLVSTKQILGNWRSKRYLDPQRIDDVLTTLDSRPTPAPTEKSPSSKSSLSSLSSQQQNIPLSRNEVNKRIEQDRERHKRLRERRWVQPITHNPTTPQLACFYPLTELTDGQEESALDIEFENEWETTSDWNEDDEEAIGEEAELAFPSDDEKPHDRSWGH
ncbi:CTD kinase subunit gamma CTK3-domain-containing protein [Crassisporium funariophilum]|nr:CTD kinase subunit gamma CTK3-domain-containing protein [Crassisporium funariophilum]